MAKKSARKDFNAGAERPALNRLVTACMTAGGAYLGGLFVGGIGPLFYQSATAAAARGDATAVGLIAGGIAGFLICASSLKI